MKNKEIYKYLMHMEEVIYDLKRSIDRMRKPKDKDEELWERVKNAAPGEWVCIDPESHVSGFIRYARDAGDIISQTNPELVKVYNDDEFTAMKLNASMSRDELIELIHKLRAKINEMTPLRPINTYGPDFKPAPPKRTMKEVKVGDKVRYVTPMPEGTWMGEAWGDRDRLKVGNTYHVTDVTDISVVVFGGGKYIDRKCFELI